MPESLIMASAGDDDLGAFFSELQEVEQTVLGTSTAFSADISSHDNTPVKPDESHGSTTSVNPVLPDPAAIAALIAAASKSVAEASKLAGPSVVSGVPAPSHQSSVGVVVAAKPQVKVVAAAAPVTSNPSGDSGLSLFEQQAAAGSSYFTPAPPPPKPSGFSFTSTTTITTVSSTAAALGADKLDSKKHVRIGAGEKWVDETLNEWPENDFRLFVGDLGNDVTTEMLAKEFQCYTSFAKAKVFYYFSYSYRIWLHLNYFLIFQVIRGGWNNKSKGYGFVSMMDPFEAARAIREKNGKYLCSRYFTQYSHFKPQCLNS
jgi:hypothetical protein